MAVADDILSAKALTPYRSLQNQTALLAAFLLLFLKFIVFGIKAATLKPIDDLLAEDKARAKGEDTKDQYFRWTRAHSNDLENVPFFLLSSIIAQYTLSLQAQNLQCQAVDANVKGCKTADDVLAQQTALNMWWTILLASTCIFIVFRIFHGVFLIAGKSPLRSTCYLFGMIACIMNICVGLAAVAKASTRYCDSMSGNPASPC